MIIDGKNIALDVLSLIKKETQTFKTIPHLAIVLIGNNTASSIYVKNKIKQAETVGINAELFQFQENISHSELYNFIQQLNTNTKINGIIIQLPLPNHIDSHLINILVDPEKDVDGFNPVNIGYLGLGLNKGFVPCTPMGCLHLLKLILGDLSGLNAVVVGRSNIVGKPMMHLLIQQNCTVTLAHSKTINLPDITKKADIVVVAVGIPKFLSNEYFNPSATVIDVGINRIDATLLDNNDTNQNINQKHKIAKIVGDVDFESVKDKVSHITPVPGGVGPMTIAFLLYNTMVAYKRQNFIQ